MLALKIPLILSTTKCKSALVHSSCGTQWRSSCNVVNSITMMPGFGSFHYDDWEVFILCGFILVGWIVICWRGLTAVIYFPRTMERRAFHFRQCFHVEDLWKRNLHKLIDKLKEQVEIEGSFLKRYCWFYSAKPVGTGEWCSRFRFSSFVEYSEAFIHMPRENPVGLWIVNHKSIEKMKNRIKKGVKYMDPMAFAPELQVERQLIDVTKRSWKMTAVSLITVIIELSAFTKNGSPMTDAMEACSQAWEIRDFVEKSDLDVALVNEATNKIFYHLHKTWQWLHYHLPLTNSTDKSSEATKEAIHNLVEKGKEIAIADRPSQDSRDWKTLAASYNLYRICERLKCRLSDVEAMLDELQQGLVDVIGECVEKVAGVIMENCREWVVSMDEEKVWKARLIAGKA
eukprot:Gb_16495 [translate_table: standard]